MEFEAAPNSDAVLRIEYADLRSDTSYDCYRSGALILKNSKLQGTHPFAIRYPSEDCIIEKNILINAHMFYIDGIGLGKVIIRNNLFYNNMAIKVYKNPYPSQIIAEYNSFLSDGRMVEISSNARLTAVENYWGTSNKTIIDTMIRDRNDDLNILYYVEYEPFLTEPHPDTPSIMIASFIANPLFGNLPLEVNFIDQSKGEITSWEWDFGDGSTSKDQNPTHIYREPGIYTVSVTILGQYGPDTETKVDYISIDDDDDDDEFPWVLFYPAFKANKINK